MTDRIDQAVVAIERLLQRFSLDELRLAIARLSSVSSINQIRSTSEANAPRPMRKRKPIERAAALAKIEKSDPAKFRYLVTVEERLRSRELLPHTTELLQVCRTLDKDFKPRKRREETISALIKVLADLPLTALESRLPEILERASSGGDSAYHELARELIGSKYIRGQ